MWESRRDFQRVWEGWKAGIMAFHAFHTLSFPWPVLPGDLDARAAPPRGLNERTGDLSFIEKETVRLISEGRGEKIFSRCRSLRMRPAAHTTISLPLGVN
jgi:hypothetical protein